MQSPSNHLEAFYDAVPDPGASVLSVRRPDPEALELAVRAEHDCFMASLDDLKRTHNGKWVVFAGGRVESEFDDIRDAYRSVQGRTTVFVVERVGPKQPVMLSAAVAFSPATKDA